MINKKIRRPFKKDFGKQIYDEQRKAVNFKDGSLKRTVVKKGRV